MHCYKLTLSYIGTHYSGWQVQTNALSIQHVLQEALKVILRGEEVIVIGSGRTDAGVHAVGQVAHFKSPQELNTQKLLHSLNGLLPLDIRVFKVEKVPLDFHSQRSAIGKEYHYHLYTERVMDPFRRPYCWHLLREIDGALLKNAASVFVGTHDFTSFANEAYAGAAARNPVRTLYRLDCVSISNGYRLEFEGNGFLYKMVRNIVGTLVDVASKKMALEDIAVIFEAKDRKRASQAAPPQGLFLMRVAYPEDAMKF